MTGWPDSWRLRAASFTPSTCVGTPVGSNTRTIQRLINSYVNSGHRALSYRFYAGGRHEILNEPERDQVHRDVGHWLHEILDTRAAANDEAARAAA
jgi:hypothetical protein